MENFKMFAVVVVGVVCTSSAAAYDYCNISSQNTLCLYSACTFSANCIQPTPVTLTSAQKSLIVSKHNTLRALVAQGSADVSVVSGLGGASVYFPNASNMRQMTWDDELARMAQAWANQCTLDKDANRDVARFLVGQNFFFKDIGTDNSYPIESYIGDATSSWQQTAASLSLSNVDSYQAPDVAGIFAQMIWADTFKIGCAASHFMYLDVDIILNVYLLVCNYGPVGNVGGEPVYKTGDPTSACPSGTAPAGYLCA